MKILLFVNHGRLTTTVGGVEKVYADFANEFARRGFEVGAAYNDQGDAAPIFPIVPQVRLFNLYKEQSQRTLPYLAAKIWREATRPLRKTFLAPYFPNFILPLRLNFLKPRLDALLDEFRPDVVVTFFLADARALFYKRSHVDFATIQTAHNPASVFFDEAASTKEITALLDRFDVAQILLPSFAPDFRAVCSTEIVAIPNVVPQFAESVDVDRREREGAPRLVCVGRLDERQKRQHIAIEAFAKIADACPDWTLHCYGDEYKSSRYSGRLRQLISDRNLQNRVFIHPSTPNVKEELLKSDIFAFPSLFEGFGLALGEALSVGLPAVGFADAPAVNELVVDGENGFLARDVDDFAEKLKTLIDSKELRRRFGANAKKSVEKFEASKVWDAWEKLLRETVEKKRAQPPQNR